MSILLKTLLLTAVSGVLAAPTAIAPRTDYANTDGGVGSPFPLHKSCNATQAHLLAKGLNETIELVTVARDHVLKYANKSELYRKFFGNRPPYEVIGAYELVINGDKSDVLFRCDNPDGNCVFPDWGGHWRGENGSSETVICDLSYQTRKTLDYMCMLGYTVSGQPANTFWASDLLHRLFHVPSVGWEYVEHYADDYAEVIDLAANETSSESTHDSDTLQFFALEVYAHEIAVPGIGCAGTTQPEASDAVTASQTTSEAASTTVSVPDGCHTHDGGELHCDESASTEAASSTSAAAESSTPAAAATSSAAVSVSSAATETSTGGAECHTHDNGDVHCS